MSGVLDGSRGLRSGFVGAVASALLLVASSGCGADHIGMHDKSPRTSPSSRAHGVVHIGRIPVTTDTSELPLPLDPYRLTNLQFDRIRNGYNRIVSKCMTNFGISYDIPIYKTLIPAGFNSPLRMSGLFGYQSMAYAKVWGYHSSVANYSPAHTEHVGGLRGAVLYGPAAVRKQSLSLLHGRKIPVGGCSGSATRLITGSPDGNLVGDSELAVGLRQDSLSESQRDPRVRRVFTLWSKCMKTSGFKYGSPLEPYRDPRWDLGSGRPTPAERRAAVRDQECRAKTNLVGIWYAVDFALERQAVKENERELRAVRLDIRRRVARAT